jgi:hypothetical protein
MMWNLYGKRYETLQFYIGSRCNFKVRKKNPRIPPLSYNKPPALLFQTTRIVVWNYPPRCVLLSVRPFRFFEKPSILNFLPFYIHLIWNEAKPVNGLWVVYFLAHIFRFIGSWTMSVSKLEHSTIIIKTNSSVPLSLYHISRTKVSLYDL